MKKRLLLVWFVCLAPALWAAAPFGVSEGFTDEKNQVAARFLLPKILARETLSVGVQVPHHPEKESEYQQMVVHGYNEWMHATARIIREAKREEEFSDLLPVLDRGVTIQFEPVGKDIQFLFVSQQEVVENCGGNRHVVGCYRWDEEVPTIFLPESKRRAAVGLHEMGHSLGFSDSYDYDRLRASQKYGSSLIQKSIMGFSGESNKITCDDADGLINLIDIALGNTDRGGSGGWKSLCPKSPEYYINGKSGLGSPFRIENTEYQEFKLYTFRQGKWSAPQVFTLDTKPNLPWNQDVVLQTVLEQDELKRPVRARGSRGEDIYFTYLYERTFMLAVQNGKASRFEVTDHYPRRGNRLAQRVVINGQKGNRLLVQAVWTPKTKELVYVEQSVADSFSLVQRIKLTYKGSGKLISKEWDSPSQPAPAESVATSAAAQISGLQRTIQARIHEKTDQVQLENELTEWLNWQEKKK